jgi:hypothetical protein
MPTPKQFKGTKFALAALLALTLNGGVNAAEIDSIHFSIPGGAGGGWDGTARGTGEALTKAGTIGDYAAMVVHTDSSLGSMADLMTAITPSSSTGVDSLALQVYLQIGKQLTSRRLRRCMPPTNGKPYARVMAGSRSSIQATNSSLFLSSRKPKSLRS